MSEQTSVYRCFDLFDRWGLVRTVANIGCPASEGGFLMSAKSIAVAAVVSLLVVVAYDRYKATH